MQYIGKYNPMVIGAHMTQKTVRTMNSVNLTESSQIETEQSELATLQKLALTQENNVS